MPPLPYTVRPKARSGLYLQFTPNSGMKKLVLPLVALPSIPQPPVGVPSGVPEPVREALRSGLNQLRPSCHWLSRKLIAPGLTAPPKGSSATATAAPPMPMDFMP